jgi:hypothetical protein
MGGPASLGTMDEVGALPGGGFVAAGALDGDAALWESADGRTWRRVRMRADVARALPSGHHAAFSALLVHGDRLILAGADPVDRKALFLVGAISPVSAPPTLDSPSMYPATSFPSG